MRVPVRGVLAVGVAVVLASVVFVAAEDAAAVGEIVRMEPGSEDVLEGRSAKINVTFGQEERAAGDGERVEVSCDVCPTWAKTFQFNGNDGDCGEVGGQQYCVVDFPFDFRDTEPNPLATGEPAHLGTYTVRIGPEGGAVDETSFDAHISTAHTCRDGIYRRGETLVVTTSGVPANGTIDVEIVDETRNEIVFERRRVSIGPERVYDTAWRVPIDYPLGSDEEQPFVVRIETPDTGAKDDEVEHFTLKPGIARPPRRLVAGPGIGFQDIDYNRTETVFYGVQYAFRARPPGCGGEIPGAPPIAVGIDDLRDERLTAQVNRIENGTVGDPDRTVETVDRTVARYFPNGNVFVFNYTIPRDEEATGDDTTGPYYELNIPQTELKGDNDLAQNDTQDYRVHPYHIEPEFVTVQDEVERLEEARLEVNLTYADGSAFTPDDATGPVEVSFEKTDGSVDKERDLEHQGNGTWAVSIPLDFDYEPLGEYVWRVHPTEDKHGSSNAHNHIEEAISDVVDVVGARPLLDVRTIVGSDGADGAQRTQNVHVTVHAEYKNGQPLNPDNVDPSLGGLVLDVKKNNRFGRTVDVDSLTMTAANDEGDWVRTFRIGRTESSAPAGTWDLQVTASDGDDPPNENVTSLPFEVSPARVAVSPLKPPPRLVDGNDLQYSFRLTYPDGTLFTERLAEPSRGGELAVRLERVRPLDLDPRVERTLDPRSVSGGQEWRVSADARTLPPGNYFFNVTGQDIHDNPVGPEASRLFTVLFQGTFRNSTSPICPDLTENKTCTRQRGENVFAVFPGSEGDRGLEGGDPKIRVLRKIEGEAKWVTHEDDVRISSERFFNLTGEDAGDAHVGYFQTSESTPSGRYRLYLIGRAADDQGFAGYSQGFNVTPIVVERRVVDPLPATARKGESLSATIENKAGDVIDFARARAGRVSSRGIDVTPTQAGTFIEWTPPRSTPSGPATIRLEGRDLFGNPFEVTLGPTELEPLDISVRVVRPPEEVVQRGNVLNGDVELTFPDGTPMSDIHGRPTVVIRNAAGERIDTARANWGTDRWEFTWQPPPDIETGRYVAEITGRDAADNVIETVQTASFDVVPGRVVPDNVDQPSSVQRGRPARATFEFPTTVEHVNATLTTGSASLGQPEISNENGTVELNFPTTRTTPLVQPFFELEGRDEHGNRIEAQTSRFQIDPIRLDVNWLSQPPIELPRGGVASARFEVRYPDGTNLRAGQGSPIVGLFIRDQPQGVIEDVEPLEDDPTVWRVRWNPPEDARTDLPYHFAASALDRWENEAPPTSTRAFFISNPVVPDYFPTPGVGAWGALLAALAGVAVAGARRRRS